MPARADPQITGRRIALVVGNAGYRAVGALPNAGNDARLIAGTLSKLGFKLVGGGVQIDLDRSHLTAVVQEFGRSLVGADVALFYYAGHGLQVDGINWLVPIDANPSRPKDLDFQMVDADLILRQMDGAGTRLNIVLLDACRNNPFAISGLRTMQAGLAEMRAPEGTLISYATQPGNVAVDGEGADSPYSVALAAAIQQPGLDIFRVFNQVGLQVKRSTGGSQQPWVSTSPIDGDFFFAGLTLPTPPRVPDAATPASVPAAPREPVPLSPPVASTPDPRPPITAPLQTQASAPAAVAPEPERPVTAAHDPSQGTAADVHAAVRAAARDQDCAVLEARDTGQQLEIRGLAAVGPQWDKFVTQMSATPGVRLAPSDINTLPSFACSAVNELSEVLRRTREQVSGPMLMPVQREWAAGDTMSVVLHGTSVNTVLLDLYRPDGTVVHLPASHPARAGDGLRLSLTVPAGLTPGRQMLTAIAGTSAAWVLGSRPSVEPSAAYLAFLRSILVPDEPARADMVMVVLRQAKIPTPPVRAPVQSARSSSASPPSRCGSILERAQLGDPLSDADRAALRSCR